MAINLDSKGDIACFLDIRSQYLRVRYQIADITLQYQTNQLHSHQYTIYNHHYDSTMNIRAIIPVSP